MPRISENFRKRLVEAKFDHILGQDHVKEQLKSTLMVGRHAILLGPPGVGKTTLAKSVAELLDGIDVMEDGSKDKKSAKENERFIRVQGSPDLTAEDLLGDIDPLKAMEFGPLSMEAFTPGKIFKADNGILFFDELNRAPEKLQNALLQALTEQKVTIGSYDVDMPTNFVLIATMNPEDASTEKLSEVMMDRFDVVEVSYPESTDIEVSIVKDNGQSILEVPEGITKMIVNYVRSLRANPNLEKVPSVRASIGLYERAQAHAMLLKKKKVDVKDVQDVVDSVISHRIRLKPSMRMVKNVREFTKEKFEEELEKHPDLKSAKDTQEQTEEPETGGSG